MNSFLIVSTVTLGTYRASSISTPGVVRRTLIKLEYRKTKDASGCSGKSTSRKTDQKNYFYFFSKKININQQEKKN